METPEEDGEFVDVSEGGRDCADTPEGGSECVDTPEGGSECVDTPEGGSTSDEMEVQDTGLDFGKKVSKQFICFFCNSMIWNNFTYIYIYNTSFT